MVLHLIPRVGIKVVVPKLSAECERLLLKLLCLVGWILGSCRRVKREGVSVTPVNVVFLALQCWHVLQFHQVPLAEGCVGYDEVLGTFGWLRLACRNSKTSTKSVIIGSLTTSHTSCSLRPLDVVTCKDLHMVGSLLRSPASSHVAEHIVTALASQACCQWIRRRIRR